MNKNLYIKLCMCLLVFSLSIFASDVSDTGCFTTSPVLPSSYLKGWVGVGANVAALGVLVAAGSLSTKSGRDVASKVVDGVVRSTASYGLSFAIGAVVGGAAVNAWYQNVGEPELIAEIRGQDFTRETATVKDSSFQ